MYVYHHAVPMELCTSSQLQNTAMLFDCFSELKLMQEWNNVANVSQPYS